MARSVSVAIVGAGFGGIAAAVALKQHGVEDLVLLERGDRVGGVWRANTYPGLACDVPSHLYSFSFAPNPRWSRRYSPREDIQRYAEDVARRFDVLRHVRFGQDVERANFDDDSGRWRLQTAAGDELEAEVLITACGQLQRAAIPDIPGLERFRGPMFHSAHWQHSEDLTGRRVAVIGTGASAIQFVPRIAPVVDHLTVFQRTPPWILPRGDRPIRPGARALYRRVPAAQRVVRALHDGSRDILAMPLFRRVALSGVTRSIALRHLRKQVPDPELRAKLVPDYAPGCKRLLLSDDYLPALGRPNVDLVDQGVTAVRERSIVAAEPAIAGAIAAMAVLSRGDSCN